MEYVTPKEAAKLWGISERRVVVLCANGKVEGAKRLGGKMWVIPQSAEKPPDGRTREAKAAKSELQKNKENVK
jgi:hypothetical protein